MNDLAELTTGGRLSHAYIIESGDPSDSVLFLTQYALCNSVNKPCGECRGCINAFKGVHPDVYYESGSGVASSIKVDEIRKLRSDVYIKPIESEKKVYIIKDAENLVPAAANALLKVLEEPPSYALFILTVKNRKQLLPTIISRCVLISDQNTFCASAELYDRVAISISH